MKLIMLMRNNCSPRQSQANNLQSRLSSCCKSINIDYVCNSNITLLHISLGDCRSGVSIHGKVLLRSSLPGIPPAVQRQLRNSDWCWMIKAVKNKYQFTPKLTDDGTVKTSTRELMLNDPPSAPLAADYGKDGGRRCVAADCHLE